MLAGPGPGSRGIDDDDPEPDAPSRPTAAPPAERLRTGKIKDGGKTWFYWMREPVLSHRTARPIALVSDGPDPTQSRRRAPVLDIVTKKTTVPDVTETPPLGHQDPAWRPDGQMPALRPERARGCQGRPDHLQLGLAKRTSSPMTGPGYLEPSCSPDGRYIAATRTNAFGTDVVILDADRGRGARCA